MSRIDDIGENVNNSNNGFLNKLKCENSVPRFILIMSATLFVCGCDKAFPTKRYELFNSSSGDVYKIDLKTGDVFHLSKTSEVLLSTATPLLVVGTYYEMEDAKNGKKYLKYLGGGKFEESDYAVLKRKSGD